MGLSAGLDAVAKRKIPSHCRESNTDSSDHSVIAIPTSSNIWVMKTKKARWVEHVARMEEMHTKFWSEDL
jgi:hypothetical protein